MDATKTAFVDVDTQRDFINPDGALYVDGAAAIVPNLARLVEFSRENGIWLLSSIDVHSPDDSEFEMFPPHCVAGTKGQAKIAETMSIPYLTVKNQPDALPKNPSPGTQMLFEKETFDIFDNGNFPRLIREAGITDFYVFGVATDYCVRAAAIGLKNLGANVTLVTDAIRGVGDQSSNDAIDEMAARGISFGSTKEVMAALRGAK